ncbi:MAG: hypothetical protein J2P30_08790 [Actinobacteria bacterium]|nr:hypothetical protein [Actinomycetota bacterium]
MSSDGVATRVRETVLASRDRFWRPEDFSDYSPGAVSHALGRLERSGELRRIHRGLYWRGTRTPLGMAPPPVDRLVKVLAPAKGSGPAGLSAALALGLSTQVPRRTVIAVPARAPAGTAALRFVSRASSPGRRNLRAAEVAVLEVLRDWDAVVESPPAEAASRIADLVGSGEIRADRVAKASSGEPPAVRQRLIGLLGDIGRPDLAAQVTPARGRRPLALAG